MKTIFLGGTCNGSDWREKLIPLLKIDYFNPVVKDWTPECQARELEARAKSDYVLYVITPFMTGVYAIAEVVDDSNKRPDKTILCILESDGEYYMRKVFDRHVLKSLNAVKKLVINNGAKVFDSLEDIANFVNL